MIEFRTAQRGSVGLATAIVLVAAWTSTAASAAAGANQAPTLTVSGDQVRPARSFAVEAIATDPDTDPNDATKSEPVRLQAVLELAGGQQQPDWLKGPWEVAATAEPRLRIAGTVAADAAPATYRFSVTATDSRGLNATATFDLEVLAPRCAGAVEYAPNPTDACAACPAHQVPNVSKTACVNCAEDTERGAGATACTACAATDFSVAGGACEAKNRTPAFAAETGARTVPENAAARTALGGALNATDPDDDVLAYTLADDSGLFTVDKNAGQIRVGDGASVNHETAASHTVTLRVTDGMDERRLGDTAVDDTMSVTVTVTDVDEPPGTPNPAVAVSGPTSLRVTWAAPENTGPPVTSYLIRHKEDTRGAPATNKVLYCTPTPCSGAWEITGLQESKAYRVRMRATNDEGDSALSEWVDAATYAQLAVSFAASTYTVDGGGELTVTLGLDKAADRELAVPLTVSPASGHTVTSATFAAGATAATATFGAAVDPNGDDATATIGFGTLPRGVTAGSPSSATVTVNDVGSNAAPDFGYLAATRTVAEDLAPGGTVDTIAATDDDDDPLTYSLTDASGLFAIDAMSGRLQLAVDGALDHETATSHEMTVGVTDGKDRTGKRDTAVDDTIAVTVWVSDVAEPPATPKKPRVAAAGTTSLEASWTAPANAGPPITQYVLRYRKAGGTATNVVVTCPQQGSCPLSRTIGVPEAGVEYQVRLRADNAEGRSRYSGWRTATTHRNLAVSFEMSSYTVEEGAEATVSAVLDAAADRALSIPLTVDPAGGDLTVTPSALAFAVGDTTATSTLSAALDADGDDDTATLRLGSLPEGVSAQSPTTAAVRIADLGTNAAPTFADPSPTRAVAENHSAGAAFGDPVAATDPDEDELAYTLTDTTGLFAVDAASGRLSLAPGAALDHESAGSHTVTVHASDGKDRRGNADSSVDASAVVTVTVTDIDEPPRRPARPAVVPLGTSSLRVTWTAPSNHGPAIDRYTLHYREDRADATKTILDLPCQPAGDCPASADITGLNPGTAHVARIRAHNAEGDGRTSRWAGGATHRALTISYGATAYTVTGGGSVTVAAELDQAADRALSIPLTATGTGANYVLQPQQVDFSVDATSATATFSAPSDAPAETVALGFGTLPAGVTAGAGASVTVTVANRPPVFAAGATATVAEDAATGDAVGGVLIANDPDDDALSYTLSDETVPFAVAAVATGAQLSVSGALDHETAARYQFKVYASDGMDAAGAADDTVDAELTVTVTVTDVDEPPAAMAAPQATVLGTRSVRVAWTAPTANGGPDVEGYVVVREKTDGTGAGETAAACAGATCPGSANVSGLDPGTAYRFAVLAHNDEGRGTASPWAAATTHRNLTVSFGQPAYTVAEGASVDVAVGLDHAADRALTVPLSTAGDTDHFTVPSQVAFAVGDEAATATVDAAADSDFVRESVTVSLGAPLPAGVAAGTPATTTVTVEDGNLPPTFAAETSAVSVPENHEPGTAVGAALAATDPDSDPLTYSIKGASALFELDGGQIKLKPAASLDHEAAPSHTLTVQVTDGRNALGEEDPAVDDTIAVTVSVTNVDEAPSFGNAAIADQEFTAGEDIAPLTLPAATGGDAKLSYSISPALPGGLAFDGATRVLSGTPAAVSAAETYTYTATDDDGTPDAADDETASLAFGIAVAGANCAAGTVELCALGQTAAGATAGACAAGSTGACQYRCTDGTWTKVSNTCAPDRTLTLTRPAGGSVTSAPAGIDCGPSTTDCSAEFANGTSVALTGTASTAHTFTAWTGDCEGTVSPLAVAMDADRSCGATFEPDRTLAVSPPSNGYIAGTGIDCGSGNRADCTETAAHGTEVALSATADTGYELRNWTGACAGTGPCTVRLTADRTVGATFGKIQRTLSVSPEPANGNVAGGGIDCGSTGDVCSVSKDTGTSVLLTATGDDGYELTGWTGACTSAGTATTCTVRLDADARAGADFGEKGCPAGARTWTVGGNECSGNVAAAASQSTQPATDSGYPTKGSANFACALGVWSESAGATCYRGCAKETIDDCVLAQADHGGTSGSCTEKGSCSYTCGNGTWNRATATNTCEDYADCVGQTEDWTVGGKHCSAATSNAAHDESSTAIDDTGDLTGWATYSCSDGAWQPPGNAVPADATCGRSCAAQTIDGCTLERTAHGGTSGQCATGTSETCDYSCDDGTWSSVSNGCVRNATCGSGSPRCLVGSSSGWSTEAPVDGKCHSAAERAEKAKYTCKQGQPNKLDDTPPKVDGVCNYDRIFSCTAGTYCGQGPGKGGGVCDGVNGVRLTHTDTHYRWGCNGIDERYNWTCDGTPGRSQWTCTSGASSASCLVNRPASQPTCFKIKTKAIDAVCEWPRPVCAATTIDKCVLEETTGLGPSATSGTCTNPESGTCSYFCGYDGVWYRSFLIPNTCI